MRWDSVCIGIHRHLTIRSSRPHVVASAACFTLRLHASAAPPRVGLTQALGGEKRSVFVPFATAVHRLRFAVLFVKYLGTLPLRKHLWARSHLACVAFTGFGICNFFRSVCRFQMLSLRTRPAEGSRGALRHPGFGLSARTPRLHPPRLPSCLTSRSSRPHIVASTACFTLRCTLSPPRRGSA